MSATTTQPTTEIISKTRIFPSKRAGNPQTTPLSIIDSTVAFYNPTTSIWFFETPTPAQNLPELVIQLQNALSLTLAYFPHFCGSLHFTEYDPDGDHTRRYRRLVITYGEPTDPGAEFVIGKSKASLGSLVPSAAVRRGGSGCWDGTHIPVDELIPSRTNLSLSNPESKDRTLPCLLIQITEFTCGGMAIAARTSHGLADSISLLYFVNCWAKMNCRLQQEKISGSLLPKDLAEMPVFDPQLLDRSAAGDIDAPEPNPELLKRVLAMPMNLFDTWNQPAANGDSHRIPPNFDPDSIELGTPPPIDESDHDGRISFYVLHFTHEEIENIWKAATTPESPVSHHDALCAHIWMLMNRGRGLESDTKDVHLGFTIGIRTRTSPQLPATFLGSPTLIGDISLKARDACSSLSSVASKIRTVIQHFNVENVGAILHHRAFQESPQRYFHSSVGLRHAIQTSWMRNGAYDVEFGVGMGLRYVMAAMVMIDGFVQTMESAAFESGETRSGSEDSGIDVSVRIAAKSMDKLLVDPLLRRYRG